MNQALAIPLTSIRIVLSKVFHQLNFMHRDNVFIRATVDRAGLQLSMRKILIA